MYSLNISYSAWLLSTKVGSNCLWVTHHEYSYIGHVQKFISLKKADLCPFLIWCCFISARHTCLATNTDSVASLRKVRCTFYIKWWRCSPPLLLLVILQLIGELMAYSRSTILKSTVCVLYLVPVVRWLDAWLVPSCSHRGRHLPHSWDRSVCVEAAGRDLPRL